MKRVIFCIIFTMLCGGILTAQEVNTIPKQDKYLHFVYLAHTLDNDETTEDVPVEKLLDYIYERHYAFAIDNDNDVIFYLSNGEEPIIVKLNTIDDNRADFDGVLVKELTSKLYHEVSPDDAYKIIELFNSDDIIDENGKIKYAGIDLFFYATDYFWESGYNESLIAKLYFALEVDKIREENNNALGFNVIMLNNKYENKTFGIKNLDNINSKKENIILPFE